MLALFEATPADAWLAEALYQRFSEETDMVSCTPAEVGIYQTEERYREMFTNFQEPGRGFYLFAEKDGEVVGSLSLHVDSKVRFSHRAEFGLAIMRKCWSQGIGTALLDYMFEWLKKYPSIRKIELITREDNQRAKRLYERYGFRVEGLHSRSMRVNQTFYAAYHMGLEINPPVEVLASQGSSEERQKVTGAPFPPLYRNHPPT
jgi:RimJ/RimL family protein N-acetyltransferase